MKVLHMMPSVGPASFGLGPVALHLANEQRKIGFDPMIWCLDNERDMLWASRSSGLPVSCLRGFAHTGPRALGMSLDMERAFKDEKGSYDIMHQHGIWTGLSRVSNIARTGCPVPVVIAPHGSLEAWALRKSRWKKELALAFYERKNLNNASCLHAVGEKEIGDFRNYGLLNPIAVIPNGISKSWLHSSGDAAAFRREYEIDADKRILLFLSRITPKKGLPMLVEALHTCRHLAGDWQLVIAGVDEFGHQTELIGLIRDKGLEKHVKLVGPLMGQNKRNAFSAAELFILPSHSEGAPLVVLEALAVGVPVIATKASPWQRLETLNCGWWPDISVSAIEDALRNALVCSVDQLKYMGQKGKALVAAEFMWDRSAQMTKELYAWLRGQEERPSFVVVA